MKNLILILLIASTMTILMAGCCSRHSSTVKVQISGAADYAAVELLRVEAKNERKFVCWEMPTNNEVVFSGLSEGEYCVELQPEIQGFARQVIASTNILVSSPMEHRVAMNAPKGQLMVVVKFQNVNAPSWWKPSNVAPVRVRKVDNNDRQENPFQLYLWITEKNEKEWEGELRFMEEGVYVFTLFEHDMEKDVINNLSMQTIKIDRETLEGGVLKITF